MAMRHSHACRSHTCVRSAGSQRALQGVLEDGSLRELACDRCPDNEKGQSTVEIAIAFPVVLIVAVIAINALLFLSECAQFDRVARQSIRAFATAPAYGETNAQISGSIQSALEQALDQPNLSVRVAASGSSLGFTTYTATLEFAPTLFGLGLRSEVFGVPLPKLRHSVGLTVDTYRPGVLL